MVSRDTVKHVAALAKLRFAEEELDAFVQHFQKIVSYVDRLREVDTSGVDPFGGEGAGLALLRPDGVEEWEARDEALKNAPEREGDLFAVPRVVDRGDGHGSP